LATAPIHRRPAAQSLAAAPAAHGAGSDTEPLKRVPQEREDRERIRRKAAVLASQLDRSRPLGRQAIEAHARTILADLSLPESYLGWTMVAMASAFWREQVEAIPHHRRLLLLPHCLRKSEQCPAKYNQLGLLCENCGACELSDLQAAAQAKGYQVLIAEGSPTVIEIILRGHADAILGAACLNSLEKALDKILLAGIPCMAVPLLANSCRDTSTDVDWVREMIDTPHRSGAIAARSYLHLLRAATGMFEPAELERLVPRLRGGRTLAESNGDGLAGLDPVAATEAIAHDFLGKGGKHFRPFITLAAYDAMTGGRGAGPDGAAVAVHTPDAVRRIALAIEVFHKASLVHDDIEDDDAFRYGHPALHRKFGTSTAINVGDFLIGLGYRLVAAERAALPGGTIADILGHLADAHTKLCEGQGAELAWRDARDKRIAPLEASRSTPSRRPRPSRRLSMPGCDWQARPKHCGNRPPDSRGTWAWPSRCSTTSMTGSQINRISVPRELTCSADAPRSFGPWPWRTSPPPNGTNSNPWRPPPRPTPPQPSIACANSTTRQVCGSRPRTWSPSTASARMPSPRKCALSP
jgi:hypothetical protein